jgi:hypothetical protein
LFSLTTKFTKETQRAPKARRCRCYSNIAFDGYKFPGFGGIDANWEKDVLPKRMRIVFFNHKVHEGDTKGNNSKAL